MNLPEYVKYNHRGIFTTFRLTKALDDTPKYYRDGGQWEIGFDFKDNKLVVAKGPTHINGLPLLECSKEEYEKDNKGYLNDDWNTKLNDQMNNPDDIQHKLNSEEPYKGFGENTEEELDDLEDDEEEIEDFSFSLLTVDKDEYFYICDSRENVNEYYYLRALKNFEINAKGKSAWDLVTDLVTDGFVEEVPDHQSQNCLDFAWEE